MKSDPLGGCVRGREDGYEGEERKRKILNGEKAAEDRDERQRGKEEGEGRRERESDENRGSIER